MRAISSTEEVSRRTGRSPLRATAHPAIPEAMTPASPKRNITMPSLRSTVCWESSDCASTIVRLSPRLTATTRQYVLPSLLAMVRTDVEAPPRTTSISGAPRVIAGSCFWARATKDGPVKQTTQVLAAPRYSGGTSRVGSHRSVEAVCARWISESSRVAWSCMRTVM